MNVSILSVRSGWHTDELLRALSARGHVGVVVPYEGLIARAGGSKDPQLRSEGIPLFEADAVLARIIPSGSLEQIIYRVDVLHWLEERGIPVVNSPRAIERAVDKFYTSALLQHAGLPTVETVVCERAADAVAAVREFGDAVIKPIFGSMGHGIVRISDPDVAFRVAKTLETTRAVFYVQRAVDHGGRDYRLFVIGGRVLAAIERRAAEGDWRSNVARGAAAVPFDAPAEWRELAVRAAAAIEADYAGVDLLQARDGRVFVLEVNGIPGWEGLQHATGVDVAGAIVQHVEARVQRGRARRVTAGMTLRDSRLGLPPPAATPDEIAAAAQLACMLEAHAPKPGNVSPGRDFADVGYGDFVASAAAIGAPFARVAGTPLGALVREAVEATSRWAASNTNLGIVLLLAPLAKAALGPNDLRSNLAGVLDATTVDDAREVYTAIRLANPGGLGRAANQDVAREPTLPLREVMRLAADRDAIAREYDTSFAATFDTGLPALRQARADGLGWDDAIVETFLTLLAAAPDTHIARRAGLDRAVSVSRLAVTVLAEGGVRTDAGRQSVARFDRSLRDDRHSANPGTSADLTAAAIFVLLLEGGWAR